MIAALDASSVSRAARRAPAALVRAVLVHPLVMRMKAPLRDLVWRVRGRDLENPPLPANPRSLLFVCVGNICRSPFAALLAEKRLRSMNVRGVRCTSAGLRPSQDNKSPAEACRASSSYGITLDTHVPRPLTSELVAEHDMILVMEPWQVDAVRNLYPEHRDRVFLLSLFDDRAQGSYARYHLPDPFGQNARVFAESYTRIDRAVSRLIAGIFAKTC